MKLLCGRCTQDQELPLDERMELAKSRVPDVEYHCPVCEQEHVYKRIGRETAPIAPMEEVEESPSKNQNQVNHDQLTLF